MDYSKQTCFCKLYCSTYFHTHKCHVNYLFTYALTVLDRCGHTGSIVTAAHWVTGTDSVLHRETCCGEDIHSISDVVHTCTGFIVADTVGDVNVKVSNVQSEWRIPGENLVRVIVVVILIRQRWRFQQS